MNRTILTVAGALSASSLLLVDSAVKGTVLLALAAVVALILRRDSAATRHLVWLLAIVAMLVVPVLSAMLPQWRVLPAWMSSPRPDVVAVSPPSIAKSTGGIIESPRMAEPVEVERPIATVDQRVSSLPDPQPALATPEAVPAPAVWSWNWINALPLVWAFGFAVLMLRLSAARWMLWNSERLATVIGRRVAPQLAFESQSDSATAQDPIVTAMAAICSQLGIGRPVTLLIHPHKTIPVVWGILRCRLMLPAAARQWSDEQLQSVLLHELAHIKRRDTIVQLLAQVACALHWFNPLVWFAAWRLDVERERSCDDLVLASGIRPSAYAGHLLDVVTGLSPARWTQSCGLAMARKSSLEGRLTAVLGKDLNRRDVSVTLAGLALAIAVGVAVPIAMLRAADEKWNPPHGAHIGGYDFSTLCVHDGKDASFVIVYHGDFDSTNRSSSNSKDRTWTDSCTITAKKPGIALTFHRTHTAPGKLSITTAPAEGRDLGKPAPPPRKFGQKEYNLTKGRVFLLSDDGAVRQLDIATPVVTDRESLQQLAALIPAIPPQDLNAPRTATAPGTYELGDKVKLVIRRMTEDEQRKYKKQGLPAAFMATLVFPSPEPEAARGPSPWEIILEEVFAFAWEPGSKKLWVTDISEGARLIIWMELGPGADQTRPGPQKVMLREFDFTDPFNIKVSHITTSENGGTWSWGKLLPQTFQAPVLNALGEKGKRLRDFVETVQGDKPAPAPMHKDARTLYEVWQRYARTNGDIPGALLGELTAAVKQFIKYNPTWETVPKLNAILPRLDATHDWKPADVIALLDEVAGIQHTLLKPAPWKGTRDTIRQGDTLPKKYVDVPWGDVQPNGLRAAWVLEPSAAEHRLGAALKARLLVQNTGRVPVVLQVPTFHQGGVKATDAKGAEVPVSGISWTTLAVLVPVRLGPGEFIEIYTPGVGLGPRAGTGPWAGPRVGSNVLAKPGDELTLTHSLVPLDGSEVGVSEDDPHVSGPGWWLAHIQARLNRELPLPADAAERTRLLDRAVRELFAVAPTAEETAAFVADKTPDALDALAKRLVARVDVVSFSGKLPTAPAKFRVLAADANADKQPRVALGPGEYPLPTASAERGDATLKIVGRPVGDRRTNDAQLIFEATEFTGALPPDPHKLEVPDGWGTWAIVCRPGADFFYLLSKGTVRKIDYSAPRKVTDTPANDLPAEFRDEVQRQLDIHEISDAQQAEIFEKPAAPAVSLRFDVQEKPKTEATESPPKTTQKEPFTAWGKEIGGLQAGLGFEYGNRRTYGHGQGITLVVRLRNVGKEAVKFEYLRQFLDENPPTVTNAADKKVPQNKTEVMGQHVPVSVTLEPGKEMVLETRLHGSSGVPYVLIPPNSKEKRDDKVTPLVVATGKVQLQIEKVFGNSSSGFLKVDPALEKLSTGKLELEVKEPEKLPPEQEPFTAWGKEVNGVQIGVRLGEQRIYEVGESATLILRLRNNGKVQVPYREGDEYFLKNPPLITDASGNAVTIKAMSVFGFVRQESVAPGKEVDLVQLKLDLRPATDRSKDPAWTIYGTGKFQIQYPVALVVGEVRPDLPGMNLTTGKLELEVREPEKTLPEKETQKPKSGAMLKPATEQKLKWGEPVNGLRMALAWPPTLGDPGMGDAPEFYLVVQNVSEKAVRLTANDAAPNPRMLNLYDATLVSRTVDDVPIPGDWLLQPREAAFLRLFHSEQKFEDGRTSSVLKENVVSTLGQYSYTAEMTIGKAPAGAWTGKLVTGATRGSADVLDAGKPIALRSAPPMSWGVPNDGLRGAWRIIGEMRTGGQAKAELWVWNASTDVVKFSWTERADIGLAFMMSDGTNPAREAPVTRDKKDFQLHYLVLPVGQAVKLKEFAVRLGSAPDNAPAGTVSLPLTPGDWTLQAKWSDTRHIIDAAPEWHGVLDTGEVKLKVTPEGATVAETAPVKAKWPPVRQKSEWSDEFLAHSKEVAEARGTPDAKPEDLIAWGAEENGLRTGLLMAPRVTLGGQLPTRMVLRNVTNDVRELGLSISLNRLTASAQTQDGKPLQVHKTQLRGIDALYKVTLTPGEQVEFEGPPVQFGVEHDGETKKVKMPTYPICGVETGVGKVHVHFKKAQVKTGEAVVEVTAADAGEDAGKPAAKPPGANIIKLPDERYVKSVFPKDELVGEGVMWNDVQNGLSLGYRITGNEWRILGKEVKVELWVRNPGDKDVKFQLNMRPDIGLRMKLKDETGVKGAKELEHESSIVPIDVPPLAEHRLLPPGHALKVKEAIIVSLLWPENDVSGIGGHFFTINPGAYDFQCELELPGFTATGEGGKQFTPAEGEWTGKLTTRSLNVTVITPDAPAPKPPIEQVEVGIIPEHLRDSTLLVATAAGQESVPGVGEIVLHAIDIDTNKPIPNVTFVQENLLAEQWAISVGTSNHDGTLTFRSKPLPGYFFSVLPVPEGFKVAGLDEVPAGIRVGERIEHRFYLRKLGTNLQFLDELTEPPLTEQSLLIPSEFNGQDSIKLSVHDMPGFTGQEIKFAFQRSNDKLAERVFRNGKRVRAALADEIKYFRKAEGVKAGDISEVSEVIIAIESKTKWTLSCRTKNGMQLKQNGFRVRFDELDSWDLDVPAFLHPEF